MNDNFELAIEMYIHLKTILCTHSFEQSYQKNMFLVIIEFDMIDKCVRLFQALYLRLLKC